MNPPEPKKAMIQSSQITNKKLMNPHLLHRGLCRHFLISGVVLPRLGCVYCLGEKSPDPEVRTISAATRITTEGDAVTRLGVLRAKSGNNESRQLSGLFHPCHLAVLVRAADRVLRIVGGLDPFANVVLGIGNRLRRLADVSPIDVRPQFLNPNLAIRGTLNVNAFVRRDGTFAVAPLLNGWGLNADCSSKRGLTSDKSTCFENGFLDG